MLCFLFVDFAIYNHKYPLNIHKNFENIESQVITEVFRGLNHLRDLNQSPYDVTSTVLQINDFLSTLLACYISI